METVEKKIFGYKCPDCNVAFEGVLRGSVRKYECDYGEKVVYELFCFQCPKNGKMITMMEVSFTDTKFFWKTTDENIMSKYVAFEKTKKTCIDNALIYLYHPVRHKMEGIVASLPEKMKKYSGEGYRISAVIPEFLDIYLKNSEAEKHMFKKWVISDKFYSFCHATRYGSPIAELNIVNESELWKGCRLLSVYPTILPVFDRIDQEQIDWSQIDQLVLI